MLIIPYCSLSSAVTFASYKSSEEKTQPHLEGMRGRGGQGGGPDEIINICDEELTQQIETLGGRLGKVEGQLIFIII